MFRANSINSTIKAMTFSVESANKISVSLAEPGANHCSVLNACKTSNETESNSVARDSRITRVRRAVRRGWLVGVEESDIVF